MTEDDDWITEGMDDFLGTYEIFWGTIQLPKEKPYLCKVTTKW